MTSGWRYALSIFAVMALGTAIRWPALFTGYLTDDYAQASMLDGSYPVPRSRLDLYNFGGREPGELQALFDRGVLPWWSDPELRISALRPLSSALISLDHELLRLSSVGRHVHSLAWWAALIALFGFLARDLWSPRRALLATLLFAVDPAHLIPLGWLANRSAFISGAFSILALWAHHRFRAHGMRGAYLGAMLALGLALAAGEYGLSALGYFVSYELFMTSGRWRQRCLALVPVFATTLSYLGIRAWLGYGAFASSMYVDPFSSPIAFAKVAPIRFLCLWINQLLMLPAELVNSAWISGTPSPWLLLVPLGSVLGLVYITLRLAEPDEQRKLRWLFSGSFLALVPLLATSSSIRLLIIPNIGSSMVFAAVLSAAWRRFAALDLTRRVPRSVRLVALLAAIPCVLPRLLILPIWNYVAAQGSLAQNRFRPLLANSGIDDARLSQQTLLVINATHPNLVLYLPHVRHALFGSPLPRAWHTLSINTQPEQLTRISEDTLEISVAAGSLLDPSITTVLRRLDKPLTLRETVALRGMRVEVVRVGATGPLTLRFHFDVNLDDASLLWLSVTPAGVRRWLPPQVGKTVTLPAPGWPP